jgi:hypothetical protein
MIYMCVRRRGIWAKDALDVGCWMYKKTCTVTRNTPLCYTFKTLYRYQGKL